MEQLLSSGSAVCRFLFFSSDFVDEAGYFCRLPKKSAATGHNYNTARQQVYRIKESAGSSWVGSGGLTIDTTTIYLTGTGQRGSYLKSKQTSTIVSSTSTAGIDTAS